MILDITVEDFPSEEDVLANGLVPVLDHMHVEFRIFFATYVMASLLWYVNHTILHLFHTITVVTLYLQKIFLVFLCLTPLYSNMLTKFMRQRNENSRMAVINASLIMLASSSCNFFILMWGVYKGERVCHTWASKKYFKANMNQHLYVLMKTLTIPFWSFVSFVSGFFHGSVSEYTVIVSFFGVVITFIMLQIINHVRNGKINIDKFNETTLGKDKSIQIDKIHKERERKMRNDDESE